MYSQETLNTILSAQQGNEDALRALLGGQCKRVYFLAAKLLRDDDAALAATAAAFGAAFEALPAMKNPGSFLRLLRLEAAVAVGARLSSPGPGLEAGVQACRWLCLYQQITPAEAARCLGWREEEAAACLARADGPGLTADMRRQLDEYAMPNGVLDAVWRQIGRQSPRQRAAAPGPGGAASGRRRGAAAAKAAAAILAVAALAVAAWFFWPFGDAQGDATGPNDLGTTHAATTAKGTTAATTQAEGLPPAQVEAGVEDALAGYGLEGLQFPDGTRVFLNETYRKAELYLDLEHIFTIRKVTEQEACDFVAQLGQVGMANGCVFNKRSGGFNTGLGEQLDKLDFPGYEGVYIATVGQEVLCLVVQHHHQTDISEAFYKDDLSFYFYSFYDPKYKSNS